MKILIADDHAIMRSGLYDVLALAFPSAEIIKASNASEALAVTSDKPLPDIAIVDLFMPDMEGFTFLQKLCNDFPNIPVVVFSASENPKNIRKAHDLGASAYLPKSVSEEKFLDVVNHILSGGFYVPDELAQASEPGIHIAENPDVESAHANNIVKQLTHRQLEILAYLGKGMSNKLIARKLSVSQNTVKVHVSSILKTLDLDNRTQAGVIAQKIEKRL